MDMLLFLFNFYKQHLKKICYKFQLSIYCSKYDNGHKHQCRQVQGNEKPKPPYQMKIFKGYKNVIIRRDFAKFLIYHPVAKTFEEYMTDTLIPDEHIYATMSRIKQVEEKVDCSHKRKNLVKSCGSCSQNNTEKICDEDCILETEKCIARDESKHIR